MRVPIALCTGEHFMRPEASDTAWSYPQTTTVDLGLSAERELISQCITASGFSSWLLPADNVSSMGEFKIHSVRGKGDREKDTDTERAKC